VIKPSFFSEEESRSSKDFNGASLSWASFRGSSFINTEVEPNALLHKNITKNSYFNLKYLNFEFYTWKSMSKPIEKVLGQGEHSQ
jgi:hypothetical protein